MDPCNTSPHLLTVNEGARRRKRGFGYAALLLALFVREIRREGYVVSTKQNFFVVTSLVERHDWKVGEQKCELYFCREFYLAVQSRDSVKLLPDKGKNEFIFVNIDSFFILSDENLRI